MSEINSFFQSRELEDVMNVPVVHAGSVLPVLDDGERSAGVCYVPEREAPRGTFEAAQELAAAFSLEGYVRRRQALDYDIIWVDLLEMDGVAPYTYSEELPYDDMLQQHEPGVLERTPQQPELTIASLPRADSPSAERYVAEREGETAWTMHVKEGGSKWDRGAIPDQVSAQIGQRQHLDLQFDPTKAREWDIDTVTDLTFSFVDSAFLPPRLVAVEAPVPLLPPLMQLLSHPCRLYRLGCGRHSPR